MSDGVMGIREVIGKNSVINRGHFGPLVRYAWIFRLPRRVM